LIENKFVNRKLEKGGWSVPRAPVMASWRCLLCTRAILYLGWIFTVLDHRNNSSRVDMSLHSDTLSWFRANPSLLFQDSLVLRA